MGGSLLVSSKLFSFDKLFLNDSLCVTEAALS